MNFELWFPTFIFLTVQSLQKIKSRVAFKLRHWQTVHALIKWLQETLVAGFWEAFLVFWRHVWRDCEHFGPPARTYSVYQALRTGSPKIPGKIVLHDQGCPVVAENSLMARGGYYQHKEQPWPIFWSQHSEVLLVAESLGLMLENKQLCIESAYGPGRWWQDPSARYLRLPPPVRLQGNWTSIVSRWTPANPNAYPNYTHWLLDALPRLALLSEFPADTRILIPPRLHRNEMEALELMGLRERCRPATERHLQVENYCFSSFTTMLQGYNPYGIDFLRRTFLPKQDATYSGPKKIYLQRLGLSREPLNRMELEKCFTDHGWTVVDVMQLSFAQQIKLFAEADAIAGMFGSGFTNCVFCRPGCEVMAIMPVEFGLDGYLEWMAQVVGFNWHPLIISASYDYRFTVDLQPVKQWLAAHSSSPVK